MTNIHEIRLKAKLALWDTPGFGQFLTDLIRFMGPESRVEVNIKAIKLLYEKQLKEEEEKKSKFKQAKLPL